MKKLVNFICFVALMSVGLGMIWVGISPLVFPQKANQVVDRQDRPQTIISSPTDTANDIATNGSITPAVATTGGDSVRPTPPSNNIMVENWGHNENGILYGGNEVARADYHEYHFLPDGSYTVTGNFLSAEVNEGGRYEINGQTLTLHLTYRWENGHKQVVDPPESQQSEIYQKDGFETFDLGHAMYQKGLFWNFGTNCYMDRQGNRYKAN